MKKSRRACIALSAALLAAPDSGAEAPVAAAAETAEGGVGRSNGPAGEHLATDTPLRELLNHPAFAGHSRLLLPWDERDYNPDMTLERIGSLLPYHSDVSPTIVVGALNRMIDDVGRGQTVFYDLYTAKEKRADPSKAHAGLFFFRGESGAPFAVIAPGGGFAYVGSVHEGFPYAMEISRQGFNAFVLKYRAGHGGAVATQDLAAAVTYLFKHARALGIDTAGYSLWGSSAGARMAAAIGSHGLGRFGGADLPKPATVVMAYTAHADLSADEPSTFVVVGERDSIASPATVERRVAALRSIGTEVEYHKFEGLGHGFGLGTGTRAEGWVTDAVRFWARSAHRRN